MLLLSIASLLSVTSLLSVLGLLWWWPVIAALLTAILRLLRLTILGLLRSAVLTTLRCAILTWWWLTVLSLRRGRAILALGSPVTWAAWTARTTMACFLILGIVR